MSLTPGRPGKHGLPASWHCLWRPAGLKSGMALPRPHASCPAAHPRSWAGAKTKHLGNIFHVTARGPQQRGLGVRREPRAPASLPRRPWLYQTQRAPPPATSLPGLLRLPAGAAQVAPSTTPPFLWARWHCLPPSASGLPVASRPFLASLTRGGKGVLPRHLLTDAPLPRLGRRC